MTDLARQPEVWIVGEFDDALIVMPEREALSLAVLNDALVGAATWGDLLRSLGGDPQLLEDVRDRYGDELPEPAEPFDLDQIPGCAEGDWPAMPTERMAGWLPPPVAALGQSARTLFGPDLFRISPDRRSLVIARLEQLGLPCREDDRLIGRASGAWRYG